MHIYLKHPVHGTKVAISDSEAEYDALSGWVKYDPNSSVVEDKTETQEMPDFLTNNLKPKRKYQRKTEEV